MLRIMKDGSVRRDILGRLNGSRRSSFTLRMAPMIDMIFLLLLFFLVAAKWRPAENFLSLQIPAAEAQGGRPGRVEPLAIYIFAAENGCEVQIGQFASVVIDEQTIEINLVALMEKIKQCLAAQKRLAADPIEIICEPQVKWEYLAKIYNTFFGMGLTDITFVMTEQPDQ